MYGPRLRTQASNRPHTGPYSTGAVEAVNLKLAGKLIGERANRMGNRARTIKLLDLLTLGLNGRANERAFAKTIRLYLERNGGRPQLHQRPHDDIKGPLNSSARRVRRRLAALSGATRAAEERAVPPDSEQVRYGAGRS
jgi:hypothetical protein